MLLIIGYGNTLRRDDGAGPVLAAQLYQVFESRIPVKLVTTHQLDPELALTIADPPISAVLFVDTRVVDPQDDGQPHLYPLTVTVDTPGIGHHLTPSVLLLYAQTLYDKQVPAWQMTVPGVDFAHGEGLSPAMQQSMAAAVRHPGLKELQSKI